MLCLKQSEHTYYAFRCIDVLTVTENQWYLQADVSASVHIENKKDVRNYEVNDQNSLLYLLTSLLSISKSLYYKPFRMHFELKHRMRWLGIIYNIIDQRKDSHEFTIFKKIETGLQNICLHR